MKIILKTLLCLTATAVFSNAEHYVPSDYTILTDLFSRSIQEIITPHASLYGKNSGKTAFISYSHGIELSSETKEILEALLTAEGFGITDENHNADYRFTITATEARIILQRKNKQINRTVSMNIHVKCVHSSQNVLFATGHSERFSDSIPKNLLDLTDNSKKFSENLKRHMIQKRYDRLRLLSLIVITGVLTFFAFE